MQFDLLVEEILLEAASNVLKYFGLTKYYYSAIIDGEPWQGFVFAKNMSDAKWEVTYNLHKYKNVKDLKIAKAETDATKYKPDSLLEAASKCTKVTKKAPSKRKGKKWTKCARQSDGSIKRIHWGQKGVKVTGKSGNTKRKKAFRARHKCSSAKPGTPKAAACADW